MILGTGLRNFHWDAVEIEFRQGVLLGWRSAQKYYIGSIIISLRQSYMNQLLFLTQIVYDLLDLIVSKPCPNRIHNLVVFKNVIF